MTKCVLNIYTVHFGSMFGSAQAACRCTTHDWEFGTAPVTGVTQCPIGRIEEKLDDALARIEQYVKNHYNAEHPKDVRPRSGDDDI